MVDPLKIFWVLTNSTYLGETRDLLLWHKLVLIVHNFEFIGSIKKQYFNMKILIQSENILGEVFYDET